MLKLTITIVFFYSVFINNSEEKWKFYVLILQLKISGSHTRFTIRDSLDLDTQKLFLYHGLTMNPFILSFNNYCHMYAILPM